MQWLTRSGLRSAKGSNTAMGHTRRGSAALFSMVGLLAVAGLVLPSPIAGAATDCGSYTPPQLNQGSFNLVIGSGNIDCSQARAVLADWDAGKGTQTSRNGSNVDGYACTGNPAGVYSETGVLSFCDAGGAHLELQKP
jgi:hypothetical protein